MGLVEQWNRVEDGLDPSWIDARLSLHVSEEEPRKRAAALLAPAGPGVAGAEIRMTAVRRGGGVGPEALRRMLRRMDDEGISGRLELLAADEARPEPGIARRTLVAEWEAALAVLPSDWSDALAELELASSVDTTRAAVLLAPLNPIQGIGRPGFQFRAASRRGYGASVEVVHACLRRLDAEQIGGELRITRVLSETNPVGTQGPVWRAGNRPA